MFWDKAAGFYDLFENLYNGKVNRELVTTIAEMMEQQDVVLECACGTEMISKGIAKRCKKLAATDYSDGMLKQAKKKLLAYSNVCVRRANILELKAKDESFDKVVAGNVIHLLDEPDKALAELLRVCKKGGKVIIPTYVNNENAGAPGIFIKLLERFGAGFKCQFDFHSYQDFFCNNGFSNVEYRIIKGKIPCAIAIIKKENQVKYAT